MLPFIKAQRSHCPSNPVDRRSRHARRTFGWLLVVFVLVVACAPSTPTAEPPAVAEPTPTSTAEPTAEPTPTESEPPAADQLSVQILLGGPLATNEQARRAFLLSVDWQTLLTEFKAIKASVALADGALLINDLQNWQEYDPEAARTLLDQAELAEPMRTLPLGFAAQDATVKAFADEITSYLAEIAITTNWNEVSAETLTALLKESNLAVEQPVWFVTDTPVDNREAQEKLRTAIEETGIINQENIDFASVAGWSDPGQEGPTIVGATTKEPLPHPTYEGMIIGVIHIDSASERATYPPGTYLVVNLGDSLEKAQLLLVDAEGRTVEPELIGVESRANLNIPEGENRFVFTVGSVRCNFCNWVPNDIWCPCVNCAE